MEFRVRKQKLSEAVFVLWVQEGFQKSYFKLKNNAGIKIP